MKKLFTGVMVGAGVVAVMVGFIVLGLVYLVFRVPEVALSFFSSFIKGVMKGLWLSLVHYEGKVKKVIWSSSVGKGTGVEGKTTIVL